MVRSLLRFEFVFCLRMHDFVLFFSVTSDQGLKYFFFFIFLISQKRTRFILQLQNICCRKKVNFVTKKKKTNYLWLKKKVKVPKKNITKSVKKKKCEKRRGKRRNPFFLKSSYSKYRVRGKIVQQCFRVQVLVCVCFSSKLNCKEKFLKKKTGFCAQQCITKKS